MNLTKERLENILRESGISTHRHWGIGQTKSVEDLFWEIQRGECYLRIDRNPLCRVASIVEMVVAQSNQRQKGLLFEVERCLPDGRIRKGKKFPTGEIKVGENPADAFLRAMKEKLGVPQSLFVAWCHTEVMLEKGKATSYPGLLSEISIHPFQIEISGDAQVCQQSPFEITEPTGSVLRFEWGKRNV